MRRGTTGAVVFLLLWAFLVEPPAARGGAQASGARPTRAQPSYETVRIEGTKFQIGHSEGVEVWFSLTAASGLEALVMVVNRTPAAITFDPKAIFGTAHDATAIAPFYTYSAEEFGPKPTSKVQVAHIATALGVASSDRTTGDMDGAQSPARSSQPLGEIEMAKNGRMRAHTVFPGTSYLGWVYFDRPRADSWRFEVLFGGTLFSFEWTPPGRQWARATRRGR